MNYIAIALIILGPTIRATAVFQLHNTDDGSSLQPHETATTDLLKRIKSKAWRITEPEKLHTTGLYSVIRHPMYTGGFLFCAGLFHLLTGSLGTTIALLYLSMQFIMQRVDSEEQILSSKFGEEYTSYENRTKRFIPYLL
jgi:protein-S-isoprenylcysteine O-methyltransferase Ste14